MGMPFGPTWDMLRFRNIDLGGLVRSRRQLLDSVVYMPKVSIKIIKSLAGVRVILWQKKVFLAGITVILSGVSVISWQG